MPPVKINVYQWLLKGVRSNILTFYWALNCPPASQLRQSWWLCGASQYNQVNSFSPAGNHNPCSPLQNWWNYIFKSSLICWLDITIDLDYDCRFITSRLLGNIYMQTFPFLLFLTRSWHISTKSTKPLYQLQKKKRRQPEKKRLEHKRNFSLGK